MKVAISFQQMEHSDALENYVIEKLEKISELLKNEDQRPLHVDVFLKARKQHPHHEVEIHLKAAHFSIDAHDEEPDMYIAIDKTVDRIIGMIKKQKSKLKDKMHRPETEKTKFYK